MGRLVFWGLLADVIQFATQNHLTIGDVTDSGWPEALLAAISNKVQETLAGANRVVVSVDPEQQQGIRGNPAVPASTVSGFGVARPGNKPAGVFGGYGCGGVLGGGYGGGTFGKSAAEGDGGGFDGLVSDDLQRAGVSVGGSVDGEMLDAESDGDSVSGIDGPEAVGGF